MKVKYKMYILKQSCLQTFKKISFVIFLAFVFGADVAAQCFKSKPGGPEFYYKINKSVIEAVNKEGDFSSSNSKPTGS